MKFASYLLCALTAISFASNAQWSTSGSNTYYNSGNVGIGTSSPGALLHTVSATDNRFWMNSGSTTSLTGISLFNNTGSAGLSMVAFGSAFSGASFQRPNGSAIYTTASGAGAGGIALAAQNSDGYITFHTGGTTERLRMDKDGNVGIGTSAPQEKLQVQGNIVMDQGASPTIFTGTGALTGQRYLRFVTSPQSGYTTSSGLMAGGVLVSDNYSYATPSRNDLVVKGAIGIGTGSTAPAAMLEVKGPYGSTSQVIINTTSSNAELRFSENGTSKGYVWYSATNNQMGFGRGDATSSMFITAAGNFGIGTQAPGNYKLAVEGSLGAREIVVRTETWADYVFDRNYSLPSLDFVQHYISENGHLPDVPSEEEVLTNGQNLGEMNAILLKKIEELTLYLIAQQHQLDRLKEENLKQGDAIQQRGSKQ